MAARMALWNVVFSPPRMTGVTGGVGNDALPVSEVMTFPVNSSRIRIWIIGEVQGDPIVSDHRLMPFRPP